MKTSLDQPEGDLVHPTYAERYRYNAADILEVRVRPTRDGVAYRIALNTTVGRHEDAAEITLRSGAGEREVEVRAGESETSVTLCERGSGRNRDRE